ncbi:heterokaryon incompatibility protein-domain-containing protein [Astrocystis sublimbata]|nr:heterokaryon incompatibility protein-domain-containing protein [Astrocystis sublimbata]
MLCDRCTGIFQLEDPFGSRARTNVISHHANTQLLVSSVEAGCPICQAILSGIDDTHKLLADRRVPFLTKCFMRTMEPETPSQHYFVMNFVHALNGHYKPSPFLFIEQCQNTRPCLPQDRLGDHRDQDSRTSQLMNSWMHGCLQQHPQCRALHAWKRSGSKLQPKRLVDIGDADATTWRLILREDGTSSSKTYATLSHRWNQGGQFTLLSTNIQSFVSSSQPLAILPPVFQDAVKVTRSLGIRYLWVDCLCIVQDSYPDWDAESLDMCNIFSNSICTISLTGFNDNSTGFLDKISHKAPFPRRVQPRWAPNVNGGWCIIDSSLWTSQVTNAPLSKRGWVFQEHFLAPRVIHFGSEQLLWACSSLLACEAFPHGIPEAGQSLRPFDLKYDFALQQDRRGDFAFEHHLAPMNKEDLLLWWCNIVQQYTRTALTRPQDKLIALAGVGEAVSRAEGPPDADDSRGYHAGLLTQHLPLMLEWHLEGDLTLPYKPAGVRPPAYRAPSWSWACLDGPVSYDYLPQRLNGHELGWAESSWKTLIKFVNGNTSDNVDGAGWPIPDRCTGWKPLVCDVKSTVITTNRASSFGQVSGGRLELTGLLVPAADLIRAQDSIEQRCLRLCHPYQDTEADVVTSISGTTSLLPLRCIQLHGSDNDGPFYWATSLLLSPLDAPVSTYRRCGMLSILYTDGVRELGVEITDHPFTAKYPDDTPLETITIV